MTSKTSAEEYLESEESMRMIVSDSEMRDMLIDVRVCSGWRNAMKIMQTTVMMVGCMAVNSVVRVVLYVTDGGDFDGDGFYKLRLTYLRLTYLRHDHLSGHSISPLATYSVFTTLVARSFTMIRNTIRKHTDS